MTVSRAVPRAVVRTQRGPAHRCEVFASGLPGVTVTVTESARSFGRHWHDAHGLGLIEVGAHRSASGRRQVEAFAGQVIAHNPGEVHDGHPIGGARRWRMLTLEPGALARLTSDDLASRFEWSNAVLTDPALGAALRAAFARLPVARHAGPSPSDGGLARFEEALIEAIGHAVAPRRPADVPPRSGDMDRVLQRLCDDVARTPTLDELALIAGTTRFVVVRRFGDRHGLPPLAWLQQWRLERARERITAGMALAEAAASCGFSDQSHLTRQFVRKFGYTPGAWQRAVR